jgi:predicted aspartyl protease
VRGVGGALAALLLAVAAGGCVPAGSLVAGLPGACGPLFVGELPVALIHNVPLVEVSIDGSQAILVLDTGSQRTVLTPSAAARLGLPLAEGRRRRFYGLSGSIDSRDVAVRQFSAGGVALRRAEIVVAPITVAHLDNLVPDGVLGADTLTRFDLDLDLPDRRLILYRRQSCPQAVPAWSPPYVRVAAAVANGGQPVIPVVLDGRRLPAIVDTGAQRSVVGAEAAATAGVGAAALANDPQTMTHGAAGQVVPSHAHRFGSLLAGGDMARRPVLVVVKNTLADNFLVLGNDFLRVQRIWISYGSRRIFLWRGPRHAIDPGGGSRY